MSVCREALAAGVAARGKRAARGREKVAAEKAAREKEAAVSGEEAALAAQKPLFNRKTTF